MEKSTFNEFFTYLDKTQLKFFIDSMSFQKQVYFRYSEVLMCELSVIYSDL